MDRVGEAVGDIESCAGLGGWLGAISICDDIVGVITKVMEKGKVRGYYYIFG
jgi:hypothetical protein